MRGAVTEGTSLDKMRILYYAAGINNNLKFRMITNLIILPYYISNQQILQIIYNLKKCIDKTKIFDTILS